ncbi:MAG: hypothetical protein IJ511_06780, partial [Bacteroides sp.]|nr:hypothetical protein [Bacteroides sp.]
TMDPLAEKYYGISPYAYCLNNPTKLVDPNGKEGIRYTDRRDNKKIVEANIVVLLDKTEDIPEGVTQAQKEKIEKRNARIEKRNQRKLERVREDLNAAYNGSDGEGSPGSDRELVKFKFNVIGKPVSDTTGKGENLTRIAYENGLPAKGTPGRRAVATVITTGSTGGALGLHKGAQITISAAAPQYTISHEVGHSLKLNDSYGNGSSATSGIMFSPPTPVISSEVDEIWANALDKL